MLTLIGLVALGLVVRLSSVFIPLGLALLVAYIFEPVFKWFDRHRARRSVTVTSVYAVLIVGLFTASFRLGPVLIEQSSQLFAFVEQKGLEHDITWESIIGNEQKTDSNKNAHPISRSWWSRIRGKKDSTPKALSQKDKNSESDGESGKNGGDESGDGNPDDKEGVAQLARTHLQGLRENLPTWLFQASAVILSGASLVANYLTQTVLVFFYAFFFMLNFPKIERAATAWVPLSHETEICYVLNEINGAVSGFFRGRFIVCFVSGAVTTLGLLLSGINYWLILGIAAGVLNIIPFIGFIVVFVPSILIALVSENAVFSTVGVVLTFAAVEGVVEPFVGPLVIAQGVRLHPVTIVAAVMAGGALFGVLGVFLAVPVTAILKILSEHYLMPVIWDLLGPIRSGKS